MRFSAQTLRILIKAGWKKDRKFSVQQYERLLETNGYPIFPKLSDFLEQFGGLSFKNPKARPPAIEDWHFCVDVAVKHAVLRRVETYSKIIGSSLSLLGEASRSHLLLMMDESGRVFGGYDQIFLSIGDSGFDALEALCQGRLAQSVAD